MPEQIQTIIENLRSFGPQKLAIMGGVAAFVVAVVITGALYLNRPAYETLYVGLERSDVNQIGLVLNEAGIGFDVASDGTTVMVAAGQTAQARMMLAEKGLPTSTNAGYELFDKVGSLGLTTFMQQVTRVRALEGEISRTIQSIAGIRAARVHIVMPERASFRREEQRPSASVVIRAMGSEGQRSAGAIRHMVAAAVPGLAADNVTILDSSGRLLASGDDPSNNSLSRAMGVEATVEAHIEENIRRSLAPYLGPDNFRASVRAEVNTDMRQIEETIFDPDSRVERSVQVVRSSDVANQRSAALPTSVEQNLPQAPNETAEGPESSEQRERREETTNFEINSRRVATVSNGYQVSKLSVAVVVNQGRLASILGPGAGASEIDARVAEIRALVVSAGGLNEERGDVINVSAVEFIGDDELLEAAGPGFMDAMSRHTGTMINAAAFVLVVFLVTWFGVRPLTAALTAAPAAAGGPSFEEVQKSLPQPPEHPAIADASGEGTYSMDNAAPQDLHKKVRPGPQERLARMVDLSEERTAQILRKWARQEAS